MKNQDNYLVASAYLFGFPALYIILTNARKKPQVGEHGGQALILWLSFMAILFGLRLLIDLIWLVVYIPYLNYLENLAVMLMIIYALYRASRALK